MKSIINPVKINNTIKIGNVAISGIVFLAPMAGVTDSAFRTICRANGAALVYTEMISAKGIFYNNKNTSLMLRNNEIERPIAIQLFGSDPMTLADSAKNVADGFDIIDINMGCPAPKIVNNGEGSALMKNPELIGRIVYAVANAVCVPVTVKIRKGYDEGCINAVEIAKIAEQNGAAAITIHGRTRAQQYSGVADWNIIKEVKNAVNIPVIGNGDVTCPEKAMEMLEYTGCDAIMVGRASQGDPWIFKRINHYLLTGELLPLPTPQERIQTALRHLEMTINEKGEFTGIMEMRKHLGWYLKGIHGAAEARVKINMATGYDEISCILQSVL